MTIPISAQETTFKAKDILSMYNDNPLSYKVNFGNKYKDKRVSITGKISLIDEAGENQKEYGEYAVSLDLNGLDLVAIFFYFNKKDLNSLTSLKIGDDIKIEAVYKEIVSEEKQILGTTIQLNRIVFIDSKIIK